MVGRGVPALVLDRPDLADDARLATNHDRVTNRDVTDGEVAEAFATMPTHELTTALASARIAFGMVNDVAGLSGHPQLHRTTAHHAAGPVDLPAPPVRTDWTAPTAIPEIDRSVGKLGRADSALDPAPVSMFETLVTYKPEYRTDESGARVRQWRDHIRSPSDIWDEIEAARDVVTF